MSHATSELYEFQIRTLWQVPRDTREIHLPEVKSAMGESTFKSAAGKEWNNLPKELQTKDLRTFKSETFQYLSEQDKILPKCSI